MPHTEGGLTDERPSWESLHKAGYEIGAAAKARGRAVSSAYNWEYRNPGKRFARKSKDEVSQAISMSRRARLAIPVNLERHRQVARAAAAIRARLDDDENAQYRACRADGCTMREALAIVRRFDLWPLVPS